MTAQFPAGVGVYELDADLAAIGPLLDDLTAHFSSAEDPELLATCRSRAYRDLPAGLVATLVRFHDTEFAPVLAVTGFPVDDTRIGPTPEHWVTQPDPGSTLREEIFFLLLGAILGDPFGWTTLQGGRLIQNVLPIRDQEHEQSGHGSLATLAWHTEDGFHPYRCDYLGLFALRNDDLVPTTVAGVDALVLDPGQRRVLAEPRFVIRPDDEHLGQRRRENRGVDELLPADWFDPAPTAVLFGSVHRPYLRIDPYFMTAVPGDDDAAAALASIAGALDRALQPLPFAPGTACFVDNYRAVHGRRGFRARYDGRDRWLKKLVLTRDLRKSRVARASVGARVLRPTVLDGGHTRTAVRR